MKKSTDAVTATLPNHGAIFIDQVYNDQRLHSAIDRRPSSRQNLPLPAAAERRSWATVHPSCP